METPNTASLSERFRLLGMTDGEVTRSFRSFNAWAWKFRTAGEEAERG
jgi:hypothetical protein